MILTLTPSDNINQILNAIDLSTKITLNLKNGLYHQKLVLKHHNLTIIGESHDAVIEFDDHALKFHEDGLLMNTFRTQTVLILGNHVTLENLTILNTSGKGQKIGQAIALSTYGDHTVVRNCVIKSTQDTLFLGPLPNDLIPRYAHILPNEMCYDKPLTHYFIESTIIGDVDYIFGSSDAFFIKCTIISNGNGYISAPSTHPKSSFGLVFANCIFNQTDHFDVILSRPWRSGGKATFYASTFLMPISTKRFDDWEKPSFINYEKPYVSSPYSQPLPEHMEQSILKIIEDFQ